MKRKIDPFKMIDRDITAIYNRVGNNVQIDIMDISKIFAAGRSAHAEGSNVELAIVTTLNRIRKN